MRPSRNASTKASRFVADDLHDGVFGLAAPVVTTLRSGRFVDYGKDV
jgi:hypothetical protein